MDNQNHHLQWTYRAANDIDRRNCESSSFNYSRSNTYMNKKQRHAAILVIEIVRNVDSVSQRASGVYTNNDAGPDDLT